MENFEKVRVIDLNFGVFHLAAVFVFFYSRQTKHSITFFYLFAFSLCYNVMLNIHIKLNDKKSSLLSLKLKSNFCHRNFVRAFFENHLTD